MKEIDLKKLLKNGGYIEFLSDKDRLKHYLKDSDSDYRNLLNKFLFYNSEDKMLRVSQETVLKYGMHEVDLNKVQQEILMIKNKYLKKFPKHRFPDILIHDKKQGRYYGGGYKNLVVIEPDYLIRQEGFTLGHELGHHFIYQEKKRFWGAFSWWLFPLIAYVFMGYEILFESEFVSQAGPEMGILFFLKLCFVFCMILSWPIRSRNYQIELFCDDFSFWINSKQVYMGFDKHLFSGWSHPHNYLRTSRNKNIKNYEDIKVQKYIPSVFNLICFDLLSWREKSDSN